MPALLTAYIATAMAWSLLSLWLSARQIACVRRHRDHVPAAFAEQIHKREGSGVNQVSGGTSISLILAKLYRLPERLPPNATASTALQVRIGTKGRIRTNAQ